MSVWVALAAYVVLVTKIYRANQQSKLKLNESYPDRLKKLDYINLHYTLETYVMQSYLSHDLPI